jgi:hypothetical protein
MRFTLSESLKASMVQNGARLAPFCTIFAFCGAERCGTEIYMPAADGSKRRAFGSVHGSYIPILKFNEDGLN